MAEYDSIVAWGRVMGRLSVFVKEQVELAKQEKAPSNAIYKTSGEEGVWRTSDEITSPDVRERYERELLLVQESHG